MSTYVHPADPSRDNDPKLALYHAEAAREQHQAGQLHDRSACGIPHRGPAQSITDALAGLDHVQSTPDQWGLGPAHELAALRDLADAVRAHGAGAEVTTRSDEPLPAGPLPDELRVNGTLYVRAQIAL
jgi:hypothetical protein